MYTCVCFMLMCEGDDEVKSLSRVRLCDPTDCSIPGSSIHGIFQARVLEWLPFPSPKDLPDPGIEARSLTLQADSLPSEPPGKSLILLQQKSIFSGMTPLPAMGLIKTTNASTLNISILYSIVHILAVKQTKCKCLIYNTNPQILHRRKQWKTDFLHVTCSLVIQ